MVKRVKATPAIKTVDKPMIQKPEKEVVKEATVKVPTAPEVGVYCLFTKGDDEFIGIVESLEPLTVIEHALTNGVHSENESDILSLDGWTVEPLSTQEVYSRLF